MSDPGSTDADRLLDIELPHSFRGLDPEAVQSLEITYEALPLLGAEPILGRRFTAEDDRPGSPPTVRMGVP